MLIVALVCAAVILAIPLSRYFGLTGRPQPMTAGAPVRQFPLVLADAALAGEGESRYIAGSIRNNSNSRYEDVEVSFTVRDRTAAVISTIVARVKSVDAKGTATFQSDPVPRGAFRIALREVTGTER